MSDGGKVTGPTGAAGSAAPLPEEPSATVRSGERNLGDVARRLGVSEEDLRRANPQIANPNNLNAGQAVRLPDTHSGTPSASAQTSAPASPPMSEAGARARVAEHSLEGQARAAQLRNLPDQTTATADHLIQHRTGLLGSLDEDALGGDLADIAKRDPAASRATIDATMNRLGSSDRDDVAVGFMQHLNDQQLRDLAANPQGQQTLNRMEQELLRGNVGSDERAQADRIHSALGSATGLSPGSRSEVLVNRHTHGLNLDEEGLGRELSQMATRDPAASRATIDATMNRLGSTDRDDVAEAFTRNLSDQQLRQMAGTPDGQQTLNRMEQELLRGNVGSDERTQADRIHSALGSAAGLSPGSRSEVLVNRHTHGLNLDEDGLGRELSQMAARDPAASRATIEATMNRLGSTDRDDVAEAFTRNLSHQQLRQMQNTPDGRAILDRMSNEMRSGYTAGSEQQQINRIATARTAVNLESNPAFTALSEASRNDVRAAMERNQTNPAAVNNIVNLSTAPGFSQLSDTTRRDMLSALQNHPTDPQFVGQLRNLAGSAEFRGLNDAQRTSVVSDVNRFARTSSYNGMSAADRGRALDIIGSLSMNSAANPTRAAARNTVEQLVSGRVPMALYSDSSSDFGYADGGVMHFNIGNAALTTNRHELVATAAHEVNHVLNGNTSAGTRERFLDEYRAWSMERQAADGENPASAAHMRGVIRNLATNAPNGGSYDHLRQLYRDDPDFKRVIDTVNARLNQTPPVVTTPEQMRVMLRGLPGGADSDYLNHVGNDDNH